MAKKVNEAAEVEKEVVTEGEPDEVEQPKEAKWDEAFIVRFEVFKQGKGKAVAEALQKLIEAGVPVFVNGDPDDRAPIQAALFEAGFPSSRIEAFFWPGESDTREALLKAEQKAKEDAYWRKRAEANK